MSEINDEGYGSSATVPIEPPAPPAPPTTPNRDGDGLPPGPRKRPFLLTLVLIVICVMLGSFLGHVLWKDNDKTTVEANTNKPAEIIRTNDIKAVLKVVEPAVVAIESRGVETGQVGAGTGMIINSDGTILTNAHVVAGGNAFLVSIFGRDKKLDADLVGVDASNDVALIKIRNGKNFPTVDLGSSAAMEVGDPVIAIGNALGLSGDPSVTTGIISAKGRSIDSEDESLSGLLQTDAAINFGNSGGPLVNSRGKVIGINTATADPSYSQNIGFAIAIDTVKPLLPDLKKGKNVSGKALLGVTTVDASRAATQVDLSVDSGAYVVSVAAKSSASEAGLQQGDVITRFGDTEIKTSQQLRDEVQKHHPGDKVEITWYRGSERMSGTATLISQAATT